MEGGLGQHTAGELLWESAQAWADRRVAEKPRRPEWSADELVRRPKNDPEKLAIAARLRRETILSLKRIASRVGLGSSKSANAKLHHWMQANGKTDAATAENRKKKIMPRKRTEPNRSHALEQELNHRWTQMDTDKRSISPQRTQRAQRQNPFSLRSLRSLWLNICVHLCLLPIIGSVVVRNRSG
jgi:hypothetical protein